MVLVGGAASFVIGMKWALSLMTAAAVAMMLVSLAHPVVSALAMTCMAVLDGHAADFLQSTQMGNPLGQVTAGLWRYNTVGYVLVLVTVWALPVAFGRRDAHTRLAMLFTAFLAVCLIWSPDPGHGLQLLMDVFSFFGLLVIFARVVNDPECWYWIGVVGGTLAAIAGFTYLANYRSIPFTNPNVAVFVPLMGMFAVCLAFARGASSAPRQLLLSGLAIVNLLWTFLSTSRGGLMTGTACLIFLALQVQNARRRAVLIIGTLLLGITLTSLFTPLQQSAIQRLTLLFDSSARLRDRTSGRSDLVMGAWEIFKANPFGVGTGGFEATWATLGSVNGQRTFMRSGQKFAAHAGWMRVLAENGFPGFAMLAAFVLSFAVTAVRLKSRTERNLGILASLALGISLVSTEFHAKGLFFLAAGVAVALQARVPLAPAIQAVRWKRMPTLTVRPNRMEVH